MVEALNVFAFVALLVAVLYLLRVRSDMRKKIQELKEQLDEDKSKVGALDRNGLPKKSARTMWD